MTEYGELFYEIWDQIDDFFSNITAYLGDLLTSLGIETTFGTEDVD